MILLLVTLALATAHVPAAGTPSPRAGRPIALTRLADSVAVTATVANFHRALHDADSTTVLALLSHDVQIAESGDSETLDAYRAHHLPADIAYARDVPATRRVVQLMVAGDIAWVTSVSETHGTFNGRTINSVGAETMVLARSNSDRSRWLIRAIHWSSYRGS